MVRLSPSLQIAENIRKNYSKCYLYDVSSNKELSYCELANWTLYFEEKLRSQGVSSCVVSFIIADPLLFMPVLLACWKLDISPAILDPKIQADRFSLFNHFIQSEIILSDLELNGGFEGVKKIISVDVPQIPEEQNTEFSFSISDKLQCLILFSSGTTGQPKSIPLNIRHIDENLFQFHQRLGITQEDSFLCTSPLFYAHGLYNSLLGALFLGSTVVNGGSLNILNAKKVMGAAKKYNATIYHLTPSMSSILSLIAPKMGMDTLPRLKRVIAGTARLSEDQKSLLEKSLQTTVIRQYGMTEMLYITVTSPEEKGISDDLGCPVACELEIRNEKGGVLPILETGTIFVRSKFASGEYFKQNDITLSAYQNGWFDTGDIGYLDKENRIYVTGRNKSLIKKGGFNINPNEIDFIILKLQDVLESITLGGEDSNYGEEIYSFVFNKAELTENEVLNHCRRYLPNSHIPKRIFFTDKIPKTSSGKIELSKLRSELKSLLQ